MKQAVYFAAAIAAWQVFGAPAGAQSTSAADLTRIFRAQIQSISAAQGPQTGEPSLGVTRGLQIVPPGEEPAAEVTVGVATPTESLTLPSDPASEPATASAGPETTQTYWQLPETIQVNVPVTFAFDSSALGDAQKPKLAQICEALNAAGVNKLRIIGHTDASGPWSYNQKLSELRAQEVMRFFVDSCGIPADKLQAVGVGEQFPFDDRNPRAAVNRRVEFQAMS